MIGLANAGGDTINAVKQAAEFGIQQSGQTMVAFLLFVNDVHGMGLKVAQGLQLLEAFYWDMDDDTRAFAKRFAARPGMNGKMPSGNQAGVYASTLAYLNAVAATGSDNAKDAVPQMKKFKGKDKLFGDVTIRQDGRVIHPMYLFEVKKPDELKYPYDYYKLVSTIPGRPGVPPDRGWRMFAGEVRELNRDVATRHCERSEAIHLCNAKKESDCFVALLLAMTGAASIECRSLPHLARALRDQPRGALVAGMDPEPAQRDAEPVAQADQEIDVGDAPDPPCEGAAQLELAEIDHRLALADLRQAAGMLVAERRQRLAAQPRLDHGGNVTPLLFGGRRDAGHRIAVGTLDGRRCRRSQRSRDGRAPSDQARPAAGQARSAGAFEPFGGG